MPLGVKAFDGLTCDWERGCLVLLVARFDGHVRATGTSMAYLGL